MLKNLSVQNFAIIERSEILFEPGFTAITGETGAGKSILIGALNLILGGRANLNAVLNPEKKAIVEATFSINEAFRPFFEQHDLDFEPITLVRRELLPSNKSRAFINDTPVTLSILKELTSQLVDLHQQHESLSLTQVEFQRSVLDTVANNEALLTSYQQHYKQWQKLVKRIQKLQEEEAQAQQQRDFISFQFQELQEANIVDNELELLDNQLKQLNNAEEISQLINQIQQVLEEDDHSSNQSLRSALTLLNQLKKLQPQFENTFERLNSVFIELEDIITEFSSFDEQSIDVEEQAQLEKRHNLLNRLAQKHQVNTTNDLLDKQKSFADQLQVIDNQSITIKQLEDEADKLFTLLAKQAQEISANRQQKIPEFTEQIQELLSAVGLEQARMAVVLHRFDQIKLSGIEEVELLFSANAGHEPRPLKDIASGGELSRLMLALKSTLADKTTLPTMIFDEIDTGISGEVAKKVGNQFQNLAQQHQIIAITHLPQIAAKSNHHLKVEKKMQEGVTRSNVRALQQDEKIYEVAELLSGQNPSATTIQAAKELINA